MEQKFQTSFIPKKPLTASAGNVAHRSVSIFLTASILVFIASIAGAVFVFAWQKVLLSQQDQYKVDLARDQNQFNTDLINTLTKANTKIDVAKGLINSHLAVSDIFKVISQLTIASVQWKNFSFSSPSALGGSSNDVTVSMQGETDSYYSVAYESDVLGRLAVPGPNQLIKNPVLSNLSIGQNGKVDFSFTAMVSPSKLLYTTDLGGDKQGSAPSSPALFATSTGQ